MMRRQRVGKVNVLFLLNQECARKKSELFSSLNFFGEETPKKKKQKRVLS